MGDAAIWERFHLAIGLNYPLGMELVYVERSETTDAEVRLRETLLPQDTGIAAQQDIGIAVQFGSNRNLWDPDQTFIPTVRNNDSVWRGSPRKNVGDALD